MNKILYYVFVIYFILLYLGPIMYFGVFPFSGYQILFLLLLLVFFANELYKKENIYIPIYIKMFLFVMSSFMFIYMFKLFDIVYIPSFRDFIINLAEELEIPYQLSTVPGGTDAGIIHLTGIGCPTLAICVPTRHIHSHTGIVSIEDMENTVKLIVEAIKRIDKQTAESFTSI